MASVSIYPIYPIRIPVGKSKPVIGVAHATQTITVAAPGAAAGATSLPVAALTAPLHSWKSTLTFTGGKIVRPSDDGASTAFPTGSTAIKVVALASAMVAGDTATVTEPVYDATFTFTLGAGGSSLVTVNNERTYADNLDIPGSAPLNLRSLDATAAGTTTIQAVWDGNGTTAGGGASSVTRTVIIDNPAAAPVAVITEAGPIAVKAGQALELSGDDSTGVGGTSLIPALRWAWGDGDYTTDMFSAVHAYKVAGTYTARLTVTNTAGTQSFVERTINVTALPSGVADYFPTTLADLTTAFNSAVTAAAGGTHSTIEINKTLTLIGSDYTLPVNAGPGWITIRTSGTLPAVGTRVGPSNLSEMATFRHANANETALVIPKNSKNIRLQGLHIAANPSFTSGGGPATYYLLCIGFYNSQTVLSDNPENIIIDRCLINPPDNVNVVHAVLNDGYKVSMLDTYIGNIHGQGGQDVQAIYGNDGRGAHVYNNCFFEAMTENIIYGGSDTGIDGVTATNIEFRRCYFPKDVAWKTADEPDLFYNNNVKNLFEIKNVRRCYVGGCILKNHWDAERSQRFAIVLKSATSPSGIGGFCPQSVCEEVTFEDCLVQGIYGGVATAVDTYWLRDRATGGINFGGLKPNNLRFRNVAFLDHSRAWRTVNFPLGGSGAFVQPANVNDLIFDHVTHINPDSDAYNGTFGQMESNNNYRFTLKDSIMYGHANGILGAGVGEGYKALNYGTGGTGPATNVKHSDATWSMVKNLFVKYLGSTASYPNTAPDVNAILIATSEIGFNNYAAGDYSLAAGSAYKNYATDGTDPGVNWSVLNTQTSATESGAAPATNRKHYKLRFI